MLTLPQRTRDTVEIFYPEDSYAALLDSLPTRHARPNGIILLAIQDDQALGCGMSQAISGTASEIKRLFVVPKARGLGVGRALCEALVNQARADGFKQVFLDTSKDQHAAAALYAQMGFQERGPYQDVPEAGKDILYYFEMSL
nr:GNAT family N-acetyltransferase [Cognatishimia sp. MH4019]